MDLTRPVIYRGYNLNSITVIPDQITGCQIDRVDFSPGAQCGLTEKRSASDGMDASDVFLGGRTVQMQGKLYGANRAELYDTLAEMRAALSPTGAFAESPGDLGYLPLDFSVPTSDLPHWPSGFIDQMIRARVNGSPHFIMDRDHVGGISEYGHSIEWSVVMDARDPRIYGQDEVTTFFSSAGNASSGSGVVTNPGEYPAPLMVMIFTPAANAKRVITLTAFGVAMTLTVPNDAFDRTLRYNGQEKYVTLEEQGVEVLRMDLSSLPGERTTRSCLRVRRRTRGRARTGVGPTSTSTPCPNSGSGQRGPRAWPK